jgi:hypothetical protein
LQTKHSVTIEDGGQRLIEFEEELSEDLRPVLVVNIRQLGNPVAPFTRNAGCLKTKAADGTQKKVNGVNFNEMSHYQEISARDSSQSMSMLDEGESERDSSEPRPSDDSMYDIDP